jgi:hypothetical protein
LAAIALLALVAAVISDSVDGSFWSRHALFTSLVASLLIVMLSVAVLNEVLERRGRERWSVLAQYVMLELVRTARLIWTGVLEEVGLLSAEAARPDLVDVNGELVRDTPRLRAAVADWISDESRRSRLHDEIARLAVYTDEVLGRWAGVMLNADVYAELIDRHVELASDISWLNGLLDNSDPPDDHRRQRRARSSPAVQVEGEISGEALVDRVVVIAQLAEELDRITLQLAIRIVPVEWWQARLGTNVSVDLGAADVARS